MKLVLAVVQGQDSDAALDALVERGFIATRINSSGGFLRERNATILVGVQEESMAEVMRIIRQTCQAQTRFVNPLTPFIEPAEAALSQPVSVEVGGATVFVLDVERFERIT